MATNWKPFPGLQPANHECFDAQLKMRFRKWLGGIRHADSHLELGRALGMCEGQVNAMYDLGSPQAYRYLSALRRAQRLLDRKAEDGFTVRRAPDSRFTRAGECRQCIRMGYQCPLCRDEQRAAWRAEVEAL